LQAVKCHADSNAKNTAANPRPTYTMFSNMFASKVLKEYKVVEDNTEQMRLCATLSYVSYKNGKWMIRLILQS
jgi:hypothetical protein